MESRKTLLLILGVCVLAAALTLFQLVAVYLMSLAEAPQAYGRFGALIMQASDLPTLKQACLALTRFDEAERQGRVSLLIYSPLIALVTCTVCIVLSGWALVKMPKTTP